MQYDFVQEIAIYGFNRKVNKHLGESFDQSTTKYPRYIVKHTFHFATGDFNLKPECADKLAGRYISLPIIIDLIT